MTQPFYFPDGRAANNSEDLLALCEQYPDDATGFLVRQDLEKWLADIGSHDVAECAVDARQIDASDRSKLANFLTKCHALSAPEPVSFAEPDAEPEITPEANLTSQPAAFEAELTTREPEPQPIPPSPTAPPQPEVTVSPVVEAIPPQTPISLPTADNTAKSSEKPSFFQVIAKVILKIFY